MKLSDYALACSIAFENATSNGVLVDANNPKAEFFMRCFENVLLGVQDGLIKHVSEEITFNGDFNEIDLTDMFNRGVFTRNHPTSF